MGVKKGVFAIIYSSSEAWYKIECWGKLLYILSSDIKLCAIAFREAHLRPSLKYVLMMEKPDL